MVFAKASDIEIVKGVVQQTFLKFGYDQRHPDYPMHVAKLIISFYSAPIRHYHTVEHLVNVVQNCEDLISCDNCVAPEEILMGAIFHDAIYIPAAAPDDAHQSAELAFVTALGGGINHAAARRISELVRVTATHKPETVDQQILCDSDLAVLGYDEIIYEDYTRKIKKEFSFIPDDIYIQGRQFVLRSFLNRERIFHTDTYYKKYEKSARHNIQEEIYSLTHNKTKLGIIR